MLKNLLLLVGCSVFLLDASASPALAADSLEKRTTAPQNVDQLWGNYDPTVEPLNTKVVREWTEDGVRMQYVVFDVATFNGKVSRLAGFYGVPEKFAGKKDAKLAGILQIHGGGQRAGKSVTLEYAKRGFAIFASNWGGREMEDAKPGDENTNWGAVNPTQTNVGGYSSLSPKLNNVDPFTSPRNNNWFLLALGHRRSLTFLAAQPEVDPERLGAIGHSMGGRGTGLVTGSDKRVKVASPSVGGTGFLQQDWNGIKGVARRIRSDDPEKYDENLALFQKTLGGQAFLERIECPILFLSGTNDFNAPMECVEMGLGVVKSKKEEIARAYATHFNHRFCPESQIARPLWMLSHLNGKMKFPKPPTGKLELKTKNHVPRFVVTPGSPQKVRDVKIYYGYYPDPRIRYWASAKVKRNGDTWSGECPVFDTKQPLFVLANVYYDVPEELRLEHDPELFLLSTTVAVFPEKLAAAGVVATVKKTNLLDDFSNGYQDWYQLAKDNPHHWEYVTRKLVDPRYLPAKGKDAKLVLEFETTDAPNTLGVRLMVNDWIGYLGKKKAEYLAIKKLTKPGKQRVVFSCSDFALAERKSRNEKAAVAGKTLSDWETDTITQILLQPANRFTPKLENWKGKPIKMLKMYWE